MQVKFTCEKSFLLVQWSFCHGIPGFNFTCTCCIICYHAPQTAELFHILSLRTYGYSKWSIFVTFYNKHFQALPNGCHVFKYIKNTQCIIINKIYNFKYKPYEVKVFSLRDKAKLVWVLQPRTICRTRRFGEILWSHPHGRTVIRARNLQNDWLKENWLTPWKKVIFENLLFQRHEKRLFLKIYYFNAIKKVIFENPLFPQLIKYLSEFDETQKVPYWCSQQPATGPYHESNQSSPALHMLWLYDTF